MNRLSISRKTFVLGIANQDGGAHVSEKLKPWLEKQKEGLWTLISKDAAGFESSIRLANEHFLYMRQFAYELLNSPALTELAK